MLLALLLVWSATEGTVEKLAAMRNRLIAAEAIGAIGGSACRYDAARGSLILRRAAALLKGVESSSAWRSVVEAATHCDPALARELAPPPPPAYPFRKLLDDARAEIGVDAERAAVLIENAFAGAEEFARPDLTRLADLLLDLRREEAETADALFARLLDGVASVPVAFALGNYTFGPGDEHRIVETERGYELPMRRRPAGEREVVAYLSAASAVLLRAEKDDAAKDLAAQLLPHAAAAPPDVAEEFEAVAQRFELAMPVERVPYRQSDELRLGSFKLHWTHGRASDARQAVPRAARLDLLADFAEARQALADRDHGRAFSVSGRMPASLHKVLVHLGIAARAEDPDRARDAAFLGFREALDFPPAERAGLQLIAARAMAELDPEAAFSALAQTVETFNVLDRGAPIPAFTEAGFFERASLGRASRSFLLGMPRLPAPDLTGAARDFARLDAARAESVLSKLRSERRFAWALVEVARTRLRALK